MPSKPDSPLPVTPQSEHEKAMGAFRERLASYREACEMWGSTNDLRCLDRVDAEESALNEAIAALAPREGNPTPPIASMLKPLNPRCTAGGSPSPGEPSELIAALNKLARAHAEVCPAKDECATLKEALAVVSLYTQKGA